MPRIRRSEMESLEVLLLGIMDQKGTVTPHALYSNLTLSPASTMRAPRRLWQLGFANREEGEGTRKTAYRITDRGRARLRENWRADVWSGRSDSEEILRFITLAEMLGEDWQPEDCLARLRYIAGERRSRASSLVTTAKFKRKSILSRYGFWRASIEAARMQGESQALVEIADSLESSERETLGKEDQR